MKNEIMSTIRLKEMGPSAIYLGDLLVLGRNQTNVFSTVKEIIHRRLEGWNNHLFSKARKAILIKAVVQAIPAYTMFIFRLLTTVCKEMNNDVKRFWWATNSKSKM